ncbi:MAG: hypothetical protein WDM81_07940 [Rhizomicrobium sp.]
MSVDLRLSRNEMVLLNNALNEVCHGMAFSEAEFSTRLGAERSTALALLSEISTAVHMAFEAEKGLGH